MTATTVYAALAAAVRSEEPVALVYEERLLGIGVPREGLLRPAVILDAA